MTFDALANKDKINDIEKMYKKCKKGDEFEFMFYRNKQNPTDTMNSEHFMKTLGYITKLSSEFKLKLEKIYTMDIAYSEKGSPVNYRVTIIGLANMNKYMEMFHGGNNHMIFRELAHLAKSKDHIEVIKKIKDIKNIVDVDDFNIRTRLSEEANLTKKDREFIKKIGREAIKKISYRYKQRVSLFIEDNKDVTIRLDITAVKMSRDINRVKKDIPLYELELEIYCKKDKPDIKYLKTAYKHITNLLKYSQQSHHLISNSTADNIIDAYKDLLNVNLDKRKVLAGRKAVSLEIQHVVSKLSNNYAVTDKADGERYFLIIVDKKVYLISYNLHVKYTGIILKDNKYDNTIFDGEYIFINSEKRYIYAIFDCLYALNKDMRSEIKLEKRLAMVDKIISEIFTLKGQRGSDIKAYTGDFNTDKILKHYSDDIKKYMNSLNHDIRLNKDLPLVRRKYFIFPFGGADNEIFKYSKLMWDKYTLDNEVNCPYVLDGLIHQPTDQKYAISKKDITFLDYKWKPPNKNSMDFYILFERNKDGKILTLYDNSREDFVKSKPYKVVYLYVGMQRRDEEVPVLFQEDKNKHKAHIFLVDGAVRDIEGNIIQDNTVVEFYYNNDPSIPELYRWVPMRTRHDKTESVHKYRKNYGNYYETADRIWRSIENPVLMSDFSILADDKMYRKHMGALKNKIDHSIIMTELQENQYYKKSRTIGLSLKRYYDWIKSSTIYEYCNPMYTNYLYPKKTSGPTVLDIGCGRGDDIMKYYYTKTALYVGIDIDEMSLITPVNGAISRFNQLRKTHVNFPPMYFLHADASAVLDYNGQLKALGNITPSNNKILNNYFNPKKKFKFERISCQFSISNFLKNEISWSNFINNINNNLKRGGMILITTMDAEQIASNLKGKDRYTITYTDKEGQVNTFLEIIKNYDDSNIIGLNIPINVHNAMEHQEGRYESDYLVHKDFLIKEFKEKCNLHLLDTILIKDEYKNHKNFFIKYSKYEANIKTRNFLTSAGSIYDKDRSIIEASYNVAILNRFYLFEKM